jgi:hypothetical protein
MRSGATGISRCKRLASRLGGVFQHLAEDVTFLMPSLTTIIGFAGLKIDIGLLHIEHLNSDCVKCATALARGEDWDILCRGSLPTEVDKCRHATVPNQ